MSSYQIIQKDPVEWKELQRFCARIFNDCGYNAVTEKAITTVRGTVKVDVYAEKKEAYNNKVLCECKYWNSMVPQTIIHAFRTVVADSGASQGILISKIGFQKGAYTAVKNTNVLLFDWKQFQSAFKLEYLHYIIDRNYKKGQELMRKAIIVIEKSHKNSDVLNEEEFRNFQISREKYFNVLFYSFKEHYVDFNTMEIVITEVERGMEAGLRDFGIKISSLKEYFDYIYMKCQEELEKVDSILLLIEKRLHKK